MDQEYFPVQTTIQSDAGGAPDSQLCPAGATAAGTGPANSHWNPGLHLRMTSKLRVRMTREIVVPTKWDTDDGGTSDTTDAGHNYQELSYTGQIL